MFKMGIQIYYSSLVKIGKFVYSTSKFTYNNASINYVHVSNKPTVHNKCKFAVKYLKCTTHVKFATFVRFVTLIA